MNEWKIVAVAGVVIVWFLWAYGRGATGRTAPDFSLTSVDGAQASLANERGKVVVLDFWATWCPPCRESLPHLQAASENPTWADKGLVVWAINAGQSNDEVSSFLAHNQYSFTTLMDPDGTAMSAYGVSGIPKTVIIGRDGTIREVFTGYGDGVGEQIDAAIEKALAAPINNAFLK